MSVKGSFECLVYVYIVPEQITKITKHLQYEMLKVMVSRAEYLKIIFDNNHIDIYFNAINTPK